jgi:SAM-dependent methyltransferase
LPASDLELRVIERLKSLVRGAPGASQVGTQNKQARDAWLEKVLSALPAGGRILDAGAGRMQYRPLCAHLDYLSQDFSRYDGSGDGRGLHTRAETAEVDIVSDIASIPEPDASFDAIMCIEVLEHLPDPLAALDELARLLKVGGSLVLTAPFCSLTHYAPYHYASGFNRYFYEKHLPARGLRIVELEPNGSFFEYLAQEARRLSSVAERYASSKLSRGDERTLEELLALLGRLAARDRESHELLCYGYHVLAERG